MVIPDGVGDWIRRRAVKSRNQAAIIFRDEVTSYDVLADRIDLVACALQERGIGEGDRVAYLGNNHPSFIELLFASLRIGAIFVPLNTRLSVPELEFQLRDSGATLLVNSALLEPQAEAATSDPTIRRVVFDEGTSSGDNSIHTAAMATGTGEETAHDDASSDAQALTASTEQAQAEPYEQLLTGGVRALQAPPVTLDHPAVIIYTSGTTGRPKGAVLTHGNLTWNSINAIVDYDFTRSTRQILVSPLFHVAAFGMGALPTFLKGGTLLLQERFVPAEALDAIERLRATHISGVPTTFQMLMEDPAWETTDLSSLVSMTCGGSLVPTKVLAAFAARGLAFSGGYGMTETSPGVAAMPAAHADAHSGAAGLAHFFTKFRIREQSLGQIAESGQRGEIEVSGPNVMREYWQRPDATAEAFTDDGWLRTGDIGTVDDDGFLTIVDRAKDMIISGGENIYSAEVEQSIAAIDGVTGVAVIGVPDERWGEVPHAVVTLAPGRDLSTGELFDFLSQRLARYKVPRTLQVIDELPRTASGKVQKSALRDRVIPGQ